ncbi:MAG: translation initiation factor eIF-2B [Thermoplasmata archaeon]|nr:translation initiation factor eIF-2B [Thermoplasmata archaeon]
MELPAELQKRIDEIRLDNTSGAVELTLQAAEVFILMTKMPAPKSKTEFLKDLTTVSTKLINSQPAMAPIFNLANNILNGIEGFDETNQMISGVQHIVNEFTEGLKSNGNKIITNTLDLFQAQPKKIMTYSYSSTVLNALISAHKAGNHFEVVCSESRPVCEGITLAKKLSGQGIKVTLVVDSALFSILPEVDFVLVGADSLSINGLVNKLGTYALAVGVNESNTDFYTLCGSEKFLPKEYPLQLDDYRDLYEILPEPIANVNVMNIYFDLTPLKHLTGVITETGIINVQELAKKLDSLKIHQELI